MAGRWRCARVPHASSAAPYFFLPNSFSLARRRPTSHVAKRLRKRRESEKCISKIHSFEPKETHLDNGCMSGSSVIYANMNSLRGWRFGIGCCAKNEGQGAELSRGRMILQRDFLPKILTLSSSGQGTVKVILDYLGTISSVSCILQCKFKYDFCYGSFQNCLALETLPLFTLTFTARDESETEEDDPLDTEDASSVLIAALQSFGQALVNDNEEKDIVKEEIGRGFVSSQGLLSCRAYSASLGPRLSWRRGPGSRTARCSGPTPLTMLATQLGPVQALSYVWSVITIDRISVENYP
ncbi:hypothetical protein TRIUR3_28786 [Triticum urartu]|uniref:Uncharacterized protein n=1 Tax=Triticum urartu TaxID=4572 RepID=M7Z4X6_TRIUA|nr:hypothetical protein TRIUR3_28786 [Triticum urartu]